METEAIIGVIASMVGTSGTIYLAAMFQRERARVAAGGSRKKVSGEGLAAALLFVVGAFVFIAGLALGRYPQALLGGLLLLVGFLSARANLRTEAEGRKF